MANASHRKRPRKQHDLRGATLDRVAQDIEKTMHGGEFNLGPDSLILGGIISAALHREAQHARSLR